MMWLLREFSSPNRKQIKNLENQSNVKLSLMYHIDTVVIK
jgi:hypothetical protein